MIKKHWKMFTLTSIMILLPILAGVILWEQLPDQLPNHWNAAGEIDGWTNKAVGVFGMPMFLLAIHWLAVIATYADPKKNHHSEKVLQLIFWLIPVLSIVMNSIVYTVSLGNTVDINSVMPVFLGLLFVVIGNYLPKCKQNYTIGIKIPWTLNSEENWNRTHRFAGKLWVVAGFIMMLAGFAGAVWLILPVALIMVFVPIVYSYMFYRKEAGMNSQDEL